jgi:hypothetical protein
MPKKITKAKARDLTYSASRKMLKVAQECRDLSASDFKKAMALSMELRDFMLKRLR